LSNRSGASAITEIQYGSSGSSGSQPIARFGEKIYVPFSGKNGWFGLAQFSGQTQERVYYLEFAGNADDHNQPALLRRSQDGKIIAAMVEHNNNAFFVSISENADDATSFGVPANIASSLGFSDSGSTRNYSYSRLFEVMESGSPVVYLVTRAGSPATNDWWRYYSRSTDGGATWSSLTGLLKAGTGPKRPYIYGVNNGASRVDFTCTNDNFDASITNVYHFYLEDGTFYDTGGNALTLPIDLDAGDLTPIYEGTSTSRPHQGHVAINASGHPVIAYTTRLSNGNVVAVRCATYTGSGWTDAQVYVPNYTSAKIQPCLDPRNPSAVFVSNEDGSGVIQIHRYTTADGGATWTDQGAVTDSDEDLQYFQVGAWPDEPRLSASKGTYSGDYENPGDLEIVMLRSDGP
jgi:Neuraminidase (sialidase)